MAKAESTECLVAEEQKRALSEMNEALRPKFDAIQKKYQDAVKNDILTFHWIGTQVELLVANERKYGDKAREKIAAGLGVALTTLSNYQYIARCWSREEIDDMVTRAAAKKYLFGIGHLAELVPLDATKRKEMTKACLQSKLTVADLRRLLQGHRVTTPRGPKAPKSVIAGLMQLRKVGETMSSFGPVALEHVFDKLDGYSPAEWDKSMLTELEKTEQNIAESEEVLKQMHNRVLNTLASGRNAMELRKGRKAQREADKENTPPVTEVERVQSDRAEKKKKAPADAGDFAPVATSDKKKKAKDAIARAKAKKAKKRELAGASA